MSQREIGAARGATAMLPVEAPTTYFQGFPQALRREYFAGPSARAPSVSLHYVEALLERSRAYLGMGLPAICLARVS